MDDGTAENADPDLETAEIQVRTPGATHRSGVALSSMNWANRITLSRLVLTVMFVLALNSTWPYARTSALLIFLIAGLTDFIDGEIARRYGVITNFVNLMDP